MKKNIILSMAVSILIISGLLQAQINDKSADNNEKSLLMEHYFASTCAEDIELVKTINEKIKLSPEAAAFFINIIEKVPDPTWLNGESKRAEEHYETYRDFLNDTAHSFQMDEAVLEQLKAQTMESFVQTHMQEYRLGLVSRALEGLAIIDSDESRNYLLSKAQDEHFILRAEAAELLGL